MIFKGSVFWRNLAKRMRGSILFRILMIELLGIIPIAGGYYEEKSTSI